MVGPGFRSIVTPVHGFALLELIVVLLLLGLITALAMPNLQRLAASVARSTERDRILTELAGLGRRAMLEGRDYVVFGAGGRRDAGSPPAARETVEPGSAGADNGPVGPAFDPGGPTPVMSLTRSICRKAGRPASMRPLIVRANGVCLGAGITLLHRGAVDFQARLRPPYCRIDSDAQAIVSP